MVLSVKVVPNSAIDQIVGWLGDDLKIKVTAVAEKGRANKAVIQLLASQLNLSKANIAVQSGHSSARKILIISNLSQTAVLAALPTKG